MRITGGQARGIALKSPRGRAVRPATDRMREAVFSSLADRVAGRRFLDLFAGTGAYGLEALSRGAAGGVFVERSRPAVAALRENLDAVRRSMGPGGADLPVRVYCRDVLSWCPAEEERADLVFADPPYSEMEKCLSGLAGRLDKFLLSDSEPLLVLESPGGTPATLPGWRCVKTLGKGTGQPTCGLWVRG